MRGATKWTYWGSCYINDVLTLLVPVPILYISLVAFGIVAPGLVVIWIQWAFAEPLFLYTWIYLITVARDGPAWLPTTIAFANILIFAFTALSAAGLTTDYRFMVQLLADSTFAICVITPAGNFFAAMCRIF